MLTAEQIAIIDAIPDEGKAPFLLSDNLRVYLATKPLQDIIASPQNETKANILIGAPGSGKSWHALNARPNSAFVSYDEGGAIYDIQDYNDELIKIAPETQYMFLPVSRDSLAARRELWLKYQNDSQNIRAQTLKAALKGEFNIVVDTTSSSIGTKYLIEALRKLSFREITMEGMFAPFEISRERIESRPRPTSGIGDLVGKRIGVLEWIPDYATMTDRFDFSYNPRNGAQPRLAFSIASGRVPYMDHEFVTSIMDDLQNDRDSIRSYLEDVKENPALVAPESIEGLDIQSMMQRYDAAASKMSGFLNKLLDARPNLAPDPAPAP